VSELDDLHTERFGGNPHPVNNLTARQAELADIQYRDPAIIRAYVRRLSGRICDLPGPLLDLIATILKEPA
jgi:hypothetical protein